MAQVSKEAPSLAGNEGNPQPDTVAYSMRLAQCLQYWHFQLLP